MDNTIVRSEFELQVASELQAAQADRRRWEGEWQANEASLFDVGAEGGALRVSDNLRVPTEDEADPGSRSDISDNYMGINISARNMQLLFSQLTANAPVAMGVPVSNEEDDTEAAKGAEAAILYSRDQYGVDNWVALGEYSNFIYGTGFVKQVYDKSLGAFITDIKSGNPRPLGDIRYSAPSVWNMFMDVNATTVKEVRWVMERIEIGYEAAVAFFGPECEEVLLSYIEDTESTTSGENGRSLFFTPIERQVVVYERWETGCAENGWKGRLSYHLENGILLKDCEESPVTFPMFPKSAAKKAVRARLPYTILTYEDIPGCVWGRSPAAKCSRAQNALNACIMVMLNTAKNVGVPHLVVDRAAMSNESDTPVSNNSINIIPLDLAESGVHPFHLQPANTSSDIKELIQHYTNYINDTWGVNDALLGKQNRETQGITMQLSIMQGNMIRERLFNKYVEDIKDIYELTLSYEAKHWPLEKVERVVGINNKLRAKKFKEATISGGYSIRIERNMVFALDPITRQEQIMNLNPLFTEAGIDKRFLIKQLRLADLRTIYDKFDLADTRAVKNLDTIINSNGKEEPMIFKHEDHIGIMAYIKEFIMSEKFDTLEPEVQKMIESQIDKRAAIHAKNIGSGAGAPPQGAAPQPAIPPQLAQSLAPKIGPA